MDSTETNSIGALVRKMESDFISVQTNVSKYVQKSMYDDLNKIYAYLNSKHTSGETDSLGREKPFFNIVTAACNIWYRATDIDRNQIKLLSTNSSRTVVEAFLATVLLQDWMRRENFGQFLNEWGRVLSRFGSAITKWVEKDGRLIPSVVSWNKVIVDSIDFENNPKVEILELTEAQLRQNKSYDQDMVEKLCDARQARRLIDGQTQDNTPNYIKLYEVHGKLELSLITGNEADEDTYVEQMQVISYVASKEAGKFDDFVLVKGQCDDPYLLTHLIREDGQTLSIGAVQHLFEAQWMMNHTVKAIKDQLDLASKLIFQTSDGDFVGQNALDAIETGDILIHKINQPITQVANSSHDITSLQAFGNQWKALSNEITGISESMLGNTAPSGTAWRQVETLLQQNQSLFELMKENKGLDVETMARRFMLPFFKRKINHSKEISGIFDAYEIEKIDMAHVTHHVTLQVDNHLHKMVLQGAMPTNMDRQALIDREMQKGMSELTSTLGNQRFFKPSEIDDATWKDVLSDFEWDVIVDVTGEEVDPNAATTLNTLLMFFAKKQGQPLTPEEQLTINKILNLSGTVSPIELANVKVQPVPQQPQPQTQPTPSPMMPSSQPVT